LLHLETLRSSGLFGADAFEALSFDLAGPLGALFSCSTLFFFSRETTLFGCFALESAPFGRFFFSLSAGVFLRLLATGNSVLLLLPLPRLLRFPLLPLTSIERRSRRRSNR
jgi:hypothetical protein